MGNSEGIVNMPFLAPRFVAAAAFLAIAWTAVAGCATETEGKEDVATDAAELQLTGIRYLGKIRSGETRTGSYYTPPTYRSLGFDATGGDSIVVDVKSKDGDAVAYITDSQYNVLAYNDDTSTTNYDSQIKYTIPPGQNRRTYRIVFRDFYLVEATFSVSLLIQSNTPAVCTYGGSNYPSGAEFDSLDGCNTCTCAPTGQVSCTKLTCQCNPAAEPWRTYLGTPAQCVTLRYVCPATQVPFANTCGCGCELTSH